MINIGQFIIKSDLATKSELEKVRLLIYYELKVNNREGFTLLKISSLLSTLGFSKPNVSRLKNNIVKSRMFVRGSSDSIFKLHLKEVQALDKIYPELSEKSEEIISDDTILPESLYHKTRGYVVLLAKQINASYQHNIFDGCAVLMRRLTEILLILTYEHLGRTSEIEDSSNGYKNLNSIINYTISNKVIKLSKETEEVLDEFRELGNFSAHKIQYNCRKGDINKVRLKFRVTVEELLYQSGIKK